MIDSALREYLIANCTLVAQLYLGEIAANANLSQGAVRIQEMPGSSTDNTTQKAYVIFQISVFHTSRYEAGRIKLEIQELLIHFSSLRHGPITDDDGHAFRVNFFLNGDLGELEEDITVGETAAKVWHRPFLIACTYINAFVR